MSSELNIGIIQIKCDSNPAVNQEKLKKQIEESAKKGAELIVLQELHDSKYFCQTENVKHFDLAQPIPGEICQFYSDLALKNKVILVTSLFEKRAPGIYHNTAVVFEKDGSIAGKYRKMHIPDDPGFYEKFYFTPGDLGFEPIQTSVGKLGVLICWDQWYPEAARLMALKGAEILIYPTAIGFDPNDSEEEKNRQLNAWITIQQSHAISNGIPVVSVNRVGSEKAEDAKTQIDFWGNSFICGPQGEILYKSEQEEETSITSISKSRSEDVRRWWPLFRDRRIDDYKEITKRYID